MAEFKLEKQYLVKLSELEVGALERALTFQRAHSNIPNDDIAHSLHAFFHGILVRINQGPLQPEVVPPAPQPTPSPPEKVVPIVFTGGDS